MYALLLPFLFNSIHSMSVCLTYLRKMKDDFGFLQACLTGLYPVMIHTIVYTPSNAKFIEFNPWIPCTLPVWSLDPITIKPALCGANDSVVTPQILYDM